MIHVKKKHLDIIKEILGAYPFEFYIFGSRLTGDNEPFSDLDLCFKDEIPLAEISYIEEQLDASSIPYKVNLHDYYECSDEMKASIDELSVSIKPFLKGPNKGKLPKTKKKIEILKKKRKTIDQSLQPAPSHSKPAAPKVSLTEKILNRFRTTHEEEA